MNQAQIIEAIKTKLKDKLWRLNNLYYIKDKAGKRVKFRLNWAQDSYHHAKHFFNVILKARQLGFSTFTLIDYLDDCLFSSNIAAGVIADTKDNAEDLFKNKVKFAYDNLPDWLKAERTATQDSARQLVFNNGSSFTIGTSLRSGTYQRLLVSEYGKISAKFPEKAREIKTGALNTVEAGQRITVESTAEGKTGEFFELCEQARKLKDKPNLTRLQPKMHFYAWFDNPEYKLTDEETILTSISKEIQTYLEPFNLTQNQIAWYAAKEAIMGDDMRREYPSTAEEAFEGSLEGAYYTRQMAELRKSNQITFVPYDRSYTVSTYWDIGKTRDQSSILFCQEINNKKCFIDYEERTNITWDSYAILLKDKGYNYKTHYWPHDGNYKQVLQSEILTAKQLAERAGISPIVVIPVTKSVQDDIKNYCLPLLPQIWIDETKCALFIRRLDNYRKKWDKINSMWMEEHVHDEASHGADAFRTFAVQQAKHKTTVDKIVAPGYYAATSYRRN